jgi:hypothetical protein
MGIGGIHFRAAFLGAPLFGPVLRRVGNKAQLRSGEARYPVYESKAALNRHVFAKGAAWLLQVHGPFRQTQENFARNWILCWRRGACYGKWTKATIQWERDIYWSRLHAQYIAFFSLTGEASTRSVA